MLHVEVAGNPDGAPVVLIHGFMSSNAQWMPNRDVLGESLLLHMVELPGHGQSPIPTSDEGYAPAAILSAIESIRVQRGIDTWWVIGQSLGGAIAIQYVLTHPDRARGLVFTNSRAAFGIARRTRPSGAPAPAGPEITNLRDLPMHPINATRFPDDVKAAMVAAADAMDPAAAMGITRWRNAWQSLDRLGELRVPTMLVNGRWESAFQEHVPTAAERIPDFRLVELEGGHSINVEQADAFNRAVLDFVDASLPT